MGAEGAYVGNERCGQVWWYRAGRSTGFGGNCCATHARATFLCTPHNKYRIAIRTTYDRAIEPSLLPNNPSSEGVSGDSGSRPQLPVEAGCKLKK